ncbi:hypothetical protein L917_19856 [Phytophthora nicotianae]|uniref:DDE-1 domain-containing protein n=1 Tax=Phytophthora nicotianae TaxID=4792 RepID=W2K322_PHYNI|nr:hypothetical protein L917_19856 [Phytophthora nicotianae]
MQCRRIGALASTFIGKSKKPRGVKKDTAFELNYTNSTKAWMTRPIFSKWLNELNCTLRSQHRKRLLLPDSATVHGGFNAALLTNVTVAFFRPTLPENYNRWMQE